jgi:uncharacterized protein (DUF1501 family)
MTLSRRALLQAAPFFLRAAAASTAAPNPDGTILVVLQLAGGNDGLNTVIPYDDDHYGRARTTLRLTARDVHKIDGGLGLHSTLDGLARLYKEGHLTILQGVGYPAMHRDHDVGMRSWQTGRIDLTKKSDDPDGWLGRVADSNPDALPVAFVGNIAPPLAIHAREAIVPTIRDARDWTLASPPTPCAPANPFAAARRVAASLDRPASPYPDLPLAQSLRTVAQLIRSDLGVRIFLTEQGGTSPGEFDNHANQAVNHPVSLRELSQSITAFCDDLGRDHLLDRVLLMTFSEFGRTLTENGRHGTGHGAAAPVFLAGGRVKPGLIGAHPDLADLDNDAPKPHTDFRALYATVLDSWLKIPSSPILGEKFPPLPLFPHL